MANTWQNNDGLLLKYGTANAGPSKAGEYHFDGAQHLIELDLDLTTLTSTSAVVAGGDQVSFPANAIVEKIEVIVKTAAVGATATLDIGLMRRDRTTAIDANGLVAALPVANIDTVGETNSIVVGSTGAGALVGTTVGTNPGYLAANYNTAAFTAGDVLVRIYYRFD